ncbi:hypothetical protein NE237_027195 [Protea cynaroides]|uniref:Uncharacterized protein n=1 Tax=Protea cynaroides TaxID=273540 RepID=A0A9Q0GPN7_9MAGN|nr:hypothetical protein NE237_027195 [Protea cynaroides]
MSFSFTLFYGGGSCCCRPPPPPSSSSLVAVVVAAPPFFFFLGPWAINARVTAKGDIRRYNNARGDGKVFSFYLLNSDGGEIRVTCFFEATSSVELCVDEDASIPKLQFS